MQAILYQTFTFIGSCDSIIDFLANSYFIVKIHHAKSLVRNSLHQMLGSTCKDLKSVFENFDS